MTKPQDGGPPRESRESKAERIDATARAIIETDTQRMRAKTERLRALRVAKETADVKKRPSKRRSEAK
jgi:hypothetical protein